MEEFTDLLVRLENNLLLPSRLDQRVWKLEHRFFLFLILFKTINGQLLSFFFGPSPATWKAKVPCKVLTPQVRVLGWSIAHGRMDSYDLVQRRWPS